MVNALDGWTDFPKILLTVNNHRKPYSLEEALAVCNIGFVDEEQIHEVLERGADCPREMTREEKEEFKKRLNTHHL